MSKKKPAPKSQSEKAEERRARAKEARLENAGTAVLEGNPKKAEKLLEPPKKKKPTAAQAVEILSEAHTIEMQLTALDHKIDGIKEEYKELKAKREVLFGQLRMEVRDMGQNRLPFQSGLPAGGGKAGAAPAPGKKKDDQLDAELSGDPVRQEIEGAPDQGKDLKDPEPKKKAEGRAA